MTAGSDELEIVGIDPSGCEQPLLHAGCWQFSVGARPGHATERRDAGDRAGIDATQLAVGQGWVAAGPTLAAGVRMLAEGVLRS
jgi:hypothetical protein